MRRRIALGAALLGLGVLLGPGTVIAAPAASASCGVAPAFVALQQALPASGQCAGDEQHLANGDMVQSSTAGMFVFRQTSHTPAFTDGYRTWVLGPLGLQSRLNAERFPWEGGGTTSAVLGASYAPTRGPALQVVNTTIGAGSGPLRFDVTGAGFRPNESVTITGSYSPLQAGPPPHACQTYPLGPTTVQADANGRFAASLSTPNPHTGVNFVIRATGSASGASNLALSAVTPDC